MDLNRLTQKSQEALHDAQTKALRFGREDRIAIQFAGSKKSLASGLPMASVLFGAHASLAAPDPAEAPNIARLAELDSKR